MTFETRKHLRAAARGYFWALLIGIASTAPGLPRGVELVFQLYTILRCVDLTLSLMLAEAHEAHARALLRRARLWSWS